MNREISGGHNLRVRASNPGTEPRLQKLGFGDDWWPRFFVMHTALPFFRGLGVFAFEVVFPSIQ